MSVVLPVSPDTEKLTALLFELGSQLHVERAQRLALETALTRTGVLPERALTAAAEDAEFIRRSREALDESMAKLMRVLTEGPDPRTPLRPAADTDQNAGA
jgi:hypothetical protein